MENTTEGQLSSMANHPFSGSGDECSAASEESGWTTYIDYFMETQQQHKEASSACISPSTNDIGRRSTSESTADHGVGSSAIASFAEAPRLPALVDPSEVARRLNFRMEGIRWKKLLHDESLEDTATSPIRSPKLIDSRDPDDKHNKKHNACDGISHIAKYTTEDLDCDNCIIWNDNGASTSEDMISDDAHDHKVHNELRKKGLLSFTNSL